MSQVRNWEPIKSYEDIRFDARVVEAPGDTAKFSLRLDDYKGVREMIWIVQSFKATSQWQTYTMPIADRKMWNADRNLQLTEMDRFIFYFAKPQDPIVLEIDNIRLE